MTSPQPSLPPADPGSEREILSAEEVASHRRIARGGKGAVMIALELADSHEALRAERDSLARELKLARAVVEEIERIEWREEIDVNGEYVTEDFRDPVYIRAEIDLATAPYRAEFPAQPEEPQA